MLPNGELDPAVVAMIEDRRTDSDFAARLVRIMDEDAPILARLAEGD